MPAISRLDRVAIVAPALLLASFALLATILRAAGLRVDWAGLGLCIALSVAVTLLGLALKLTGGMPRIANGSLIIASLLGSTVCNTMAVNAGLRLGFPLTDSWLLASDAILGFNPTKAVAFFSAYPAITAWFNTVYGASNGIAVIAVIAHAFRREKAEIPLICYSGGLLTVACISTIMPAIGNMAYSRVSFAGLPPGAGTYHLPVFHYYRDGLGDVVSNAHLSGVAVFPSFHTVMGLIIATSFKGTKLFPLGFMFGIATIISAIPIGGHYVTDVLGGVIVWAVIMRLTEISAVHRHPAIPLPAAQAATA